MTPFATHHPAGERRTTVVLGALLLVVATLLGGRAVAQHGQFPAVVDEAATVDPKLGQVAELDLTFTDERGRPFSLREHAGTRPIVVNLGYFKCPGMCGVVLNSFLRELDGSDLEPGRDFELWTVSIDDAEGARLAREKKQSYVEALAEEAGGRAPAWTEGWPLLTGDRASIDALAQSVGWRFRKDERSGEFDHPPSLVVLSADGVVSRYLDARYLSSSTLRNAVIEASEGKVGTFIERLLVSCLTFDPSTHEYTLTAMTVMRIGGLLTVAALAGMILFLWRRERARHSVVEATT